MQVRPAINHKTVSDPFAGKFVEWSCAALNGFMDRMKHHVANLDCLAREHDSGRSESEIVLPGCCNEVLNSTHSHTHTHTRTHQTRD